MSPARQPTQLCAVIEADPTGAAHARLSAALAAAELATLIIAPRSGGTLSPADTRPLVELAQSKGIAALIESDAALARTLRADGVHICPCASPLEAYAEARAILSGRAIVGADAGRSRHDAMTLAEAGAEYIAFGLDGARSAEAELRRLDLVAWWAEIFEVPVVALDVERPDEAEALVSSGADFICVRIGAGRSAADVQTWLGGIAEAARLEERTL